MRFLLYPISRLVFFMFQIVINGLSDLLVVIEADKVWYLMEYNTRICFNFFLVYTS